MNLALPKISEPPTSELLRVRVRMLLAWSQNGKAAKAVQK